jgi:hypothetical protein
MISSSVFARVLFLFVFAVSGASAQPYERVLIPTVANEPIVGAFGSHWVTEISGRYLGSDQLRLFFSVCPLFECVYKEVPPNSTFASEFPTSVHGAVVGLWPDQARQTILSLRVRDLSRALETWGTEVPIVRESEVGGSPITLLNVPNMDRFRTMIRMYDFGSDVSDFVLTVFPLDGNTPIAEFAVPSEDLRDATGASQGIRFAAVADLRLPPTAPERIRLTIRTTEPTNFWAFATVTNNETQHVTVVSPVRVPAQL